MTNECAVKVDTNRMLRGSVAIYCEAPKAVAEDISYMLRTGAEEIIALRARVARLEEALRFILDECDWEESMQHACGDNRIGTAARRALEEK